MKLKILALVASMAMLFTFAAPAFAKSAPVRPAAAPASVIVFSDTESGVLADNGTCNASYSIATTVSMNTLTGAATFTGTSTVTIKRDSNGTTVASSSQTFTGPFTEAILTQTITSVFDQYSTLTSSPAVLAACGPFDS